MKKVPDQQRSLWTDDLICRQRNLLPSEIISNNKEVDDVFWNGPRSGSAVQRAGTIILGAAYLIVALAFLGMFTDQHSYLNLIFSAAFGTSRITYHLQELLRSEKYKATKEVMEGVGKHVS